MPRETKLLRGLYAPLRTPLWNIFWVIVCLSLESVKDVSDSYSGSVVLNRKQNVLVLKETRCTTCDVMTTCIDEDYHEQNDRLSSCIIRRFPVSLFIPERSTLQ